MIPLASQRRGVRGGAETPKRIQRRRVRGWKMPPNTVAVTRPSAWGNPFKVGGYFKLSAPFLGGMKMEWCQRAIWKEADKDAAIREGFTLIGSREHAVDWFRRLTKNWSEQWRQKCRDELRGKNLACFCALDQPCHADVLLELANDQSAKEQEDRDR